MERQSALYRGTTLKPNTPPGTDSPRNNAHRIPSSDGCSGLKFLSP